eukprot:TRINITY_DN1126_c0_g2_i3.p1 TRINITY_DN1126_c0_g2~~TRINITY_DN1126_c0_g2_i3.p1  ORF type:complete len:181 (+),score=44.05 TRINITY_DN1126_c0_g2_i3:140-682(+)
MGRKLVSRHVAAAQVESSTAPDSDPEAEDAKERKKTLAKWERSFALLCFLDVLLVYVLHTSWDSRCDSSSSLRTWLVGGLLLGWPATLAVHVAAKATSFRAAFVVVEVPLLLLSFAWLCAGSSWCWMSVDCVLRAPLLFWSVFTMVTFIWSALFSAFVLSIAASVLMIVCKPSGDPKDDA